MMFGHPRNRNLLSGKSALSPDLLPYLQFAAEIAITQEKSNVKIWYSLTSISCYAMHFMPAELK